MLADLSMVFFRHGRHRQRERPLRDELLSIERLEERAKSLAGQLTIAPASRRPPRAYPRLNENARRLRAAYDTRPADVHQGQPVVPAAEWLLDHFHLVTSEIRAVDQDLPRTYYQKLPVLALPLWKGYARVYVLSLELLRHSDSRLDRSLLGRFMGSFQSVAVLTIGELWAWPSTLKLALIENLRRLADEILVARESRHSADDTIALTERGVAPTALPDACDSAYVVRLLQRLRE